MFALDRVGHQAAKPPMPNSTTMDWPLASGGRRPRSPDSPRASRPGLRVTSGGGASARGSEDHRAAAFDDDDVAPDAVEPAGALGCRGRGSPPAGGGPGWRCSRGRPGLDGPDAAASVDRSARPSSRAADAAASPSRRRRRSARRRRRTRTGRRPGPPRSSRRPDRRRRGDVPWSGQLGRIQSPSSGAAVSKVAFPASIPSSVDRQNLLGVLGTPTGRYGLSARGPSRGGDLGDQGSDARLISSLIGRTASTPLPAGSRSSQSS